MRLLLTSLGITNQSIRDALEELLKMPISSAKVAIIPSAIHGMKNGGQYAWQALQEQATLGWKQVNILELTSFPSIKKSHWLQQLRTADVILVGGGNTPYLSYWLQHSGLAKELPKLLKKTVYVGISAASVLMTQSFNINQKKLKRSGVYEDDQYGDTAPPGAGSDFTLKLVDFTLRPHLNADDFPQINLENVKKWSERVDVPLYALDDQSALKIVDGKIEVISEGEWKLFHEGNI